MPAIRSRLTSLLSTTASQSRHVSGALAASSTRLQCIRSSGMLSGGVGRVARTYCRTAASIASRLVLLAGMPSCTRVRSILTRGMIGISSVGSRIRRRFLYRFAWPHAAAVSFRVVAGPICHGSRTRPRLFLAFRPFHTHSRARPRRFCARIRTRRRPFRTRFRMRSRPFRSRSRMFLHRPRLFYRRPCAFPCMFPWFFHRRPCFRTRMPTPCRTAPAPRRVTSEPAAGSPPVRRVAPGPRGSPSCRRGRRHPPPRRRPPREARCRCRRAGPLSGRRPAACDAASPTCSRPLIGAAG